METWSLPGIELNNPFHLLYNTGLFLACPFARPLPKPVTTNKTSAIWASVLQATASYSWEIYLAVPKTPHTPWHLLLWVFVDCYVCPYLLFNHLALSS